ncbi:RNA polymerase sigma factor [Halalkalibaculum sp. DA384]|uniref:RNA polymerase sigma factor n=1 Tax=Halalkalibaculum sp. DA384 TaxID=3373606 RepID=UPI003754DA98
MKKKNDTDLVKLIKKGNEQAFSAIYDRYHRQLFHLAKKYVKEKELAEDALQDVFVKLWNKRRELDPSRSIKSFLFTMLKNHLLNMIRDRKNSILSHYTPLEEEQVPVDNIIENKIYREEYREILERGVAKLSEGKREVFKMKVFKNYTNARVAKERSVSVHTVKSQFYQGCKFIRKYLKKHTGIHLLLLLLF